MSRSMLFIPLVLLFCFVLGFFVDFFGVSSVFSWFSMVVGRAPYVEVSLPFPCLSGVFLCFCSLFGYYGFRIVMFLIFSLIFFMILYVYGVNRFSLYVLLMPSFLLLLFNSLEFLSSFLLFLSVFLGYFSYMGLAGLVFGLACSSSIVPLIFLPFMYIYVVRRSRLFLESFILSFFMFNFPFIMMNLHSWISSYVDNALYFFPYLSNIFWLLIIVGILVTYFIFSRYRELHPLSVYIGFILILYIASFFTNPLFSIFIFPLLFLFDNTGLILFFIFDLFNVLSVFRPLSFFMNILVLCKVVALVPLLYWCLYISKPYIPHTAQDNILNIRSTILDCWNFIKGIIYRGDVIYPVLFLITFLLLVYRLDFPTKIYFDEIYYVDKGARPILALKGDFNRIHPPFAKELIALGILLFSDNPFAWRVIGVLLSSFVPPLIFYIAHRVFHSKKIALLSSLFIILDPLFYAQSRIAMLDCYLLSLSIIAMAFFIKYYFSEDKGIAALYLSGFFYGLAVASKLPGVLPYILCLSYLLSDCVKTRDLKLLLHVIISFVILPVVAYISTYIPTLFIRGYGFREFIDQQFYMLRYSAHLPTEKPHPYWSQPWTWPLILRPVLTLYDKLIINGSEYIACICDFGNPLTWVIGLVSVLFLIIDISSGKTVSDEVKFFILWFLITWMPFFPLGILKLLGLGREMFIYYFLQSIPPLTIIFSFSLSNSDKQYNTSISFLTLIASTIFFIYSYPVISGLPVHVDYIRGMKILKLF